MAGHRFRSKTEATACTWAYGKHTAGALYFRQVPVRGGIVVEAYDATKLTYVGTLEPDLWWEREQDRDEDDRDGEIRD